jgi:hypothetical protein
MFCVVRNRHRAGVLPKTGYGRGTDEDVRALPYGSDAFLKVKGESLDEAFHSPPFTRKIPTFSDSPYHVSHMHYLVT